MDLTPSDYISIIASLVGAIALLYTRHVNHEIGLLRQEKERLWKQIGELRGFLYNTRENYVSKKDFDGAINRLTVTLDRIEYRFIATNSKSDKTIESSRRAFDR